MFLIRVLYAPSWGLHCFAELSPFRCPCRCTALKMCSYRVSVYFLWTGCNDSSFLWGQISFASLASVRTDLATALLVCMCLCACVCVCVCMCMCVCFLWLEESASTDDQSSCCWWLVSKCSCSTLATPWTVVARLLFQEISQARVLEWVAISFPKGPSRSRDWTRVSCTGRQFLYCWPPGKPNQSS